MKKRRYLCRSSLLFLTAVLFLSACGKAERQRGIEGYIYEAELLSGTEDWGSNFKSNGTWLYYIGYGSALYRIPLGEDGKPERENPAGARFSADDGILDYTISADGEIYCFYADTGGHDTGSLELSGGRLSKYLEDGEEVYRLSLDGRKAVYASLPAAPGFLAAGREGRIFLLSGDEILVVDETGAVVGGADISAVRPGEGYSGTEKLLEGEDGRVYYMTENEGRRTAYALLEEENSCRLQAMSGGGWEEKSSLAGRFYGSHHGILYCGPDGILQCCGGEGEWKDMLRWSDSNLWQNAQEVIWISEERVLAGFTVLRDGDVSHEYYLLNRRKAEELPEKEELVLACTGVCGNDLEDAVIRFNRDSDRYHITIEVYDGEDAITKLDTRLVSSDPPDLLELSELDVVKYGEKQVLADLNEYLKKSGLLKREDFLEGILEGYTVNGRLTGIPSGFMCFTLLGRPEETGEKAGWTLEDMMALTEAYPGRKLNGFSFYFNLEWLCGDYVMDKFVNLESGECKFDSDEFRSLVQWLAEHSGSGRGYYDEEEVEDPLIRLERIFEFIDYLRYVSRSDEKTAMIGFPSHDGRPLYQAGPVNAVGITEKSGYRDGAWQFIEFFLSQEVERTWQLSGYFPSRRDLVEKMLEEAVTPGYWYEYDCAAPEEVQGVEEMIAHTDFSLRDGVREDIIGIIAEETESYFNGDKSLEEVTKVIQNRVSTLVQEGQGM